MKNTKLTLSARHQAKPLISLFYVAEVRSETDALALLIFKHPERLIARADCLGCAETNIIGNTIFCSLAMLRFLDEERISESFAQRLLKEHSAVAGGMTPMSLKDKAGKCWLESGAK